jgi:hypothetical protein
MAAVATCGTCRRDVGLMNPFAVRGSTPRDPRLIRHTRNGRGGAVPNPTCPGSGLPPDPATVRQEATRPSQRGSHRAPTPAAS